MIDLPGGGVNSLFSATGASVNTVKVNWWMVGSPELFAAMPDGTDLAVAFLTSETPKPPDDTPAEPADDPVPEPTPETDPEQEPKP